MVRQYHEQLFAHKLDQEKMDKFLETQNLLTPNHEEIENLVISVTSKEIESIIKNPQTKKSPGPDGFTSEFYETCKKRLTPILLKLFYKSEEEDTLLSLVYEDRIILLLC